MQNMGEAQMQSRCRPMVHYLLAIFFRQWHSCLLNFAWRACSALTPLSAGRNWVTINGAIVEVTGCFSSSQASGDKLEGKRERRSWILFSTLFLGRRDRAMATFGSSPTLTAEAPEIKYLWCSLSSCAYKTRRVYVEDSGQAGAAMCCCIKSIIQSHSLSFALILNCLRSRMLRCTRGKRQQRFRSRCWLGETSSFSG